MPDIETYTVSASYSEYRKEINLDVYEHADAMTINKLSIKLSLGDALVLAEELKNAVRYQMED
jgi:hypothetical protein